MLSANAQATHQARTAYGTSSRELSSEKDIEIDLFRRSIARLRSINTENFSLTSMNATILSDNLRLWDVLSVDLLHPVNQLPAEIRQNLLGLGDFVRQHTFQIFAGNSQDMQVLIDINMAIQAGLEGQADAVAA